MADFVFHGKTAKELREMSVKEFAKLIPARQRRSLLRGFTPAQKRLLAKLEKKKEVKTHCRDMVIIPALLGRTLLVHTGKEYAKVTVTEEMLGKVLGEYAFTRRRVAHNAPGVGATRSSASVSVR